MLPDGCSCDQIQHVQWKTHITTTAMICRDKSEKGAWDMMIPDTWMTDLGYGNIPLKQ